MPARTPIRNVVPMTRAKGASIGRPHNKETSTESRFCETNSIASSEPMINRTLRVDTEPSDIPSDGVKEPSSLDAIGAASPKLQA